MIIKNHIELAKIIENKKILHLNSLGKDSVVCLEWLYNFAKPAKIYSIFYKFIASHPDDDRYLSYLKKRYPNVTFIVEPNSIEVSNVCKGVFQTPGARLGVLPHFEYEEFDRELHYTEIKNNLECDFVCIGFSKYENFARASLFYKNGILMKDKIYPIGLFSKQQVYDIIFKTGLKLHPQYKTTASTYDHPSYWKMREGMKQNPTYRERLYKLYPMMILDEFRYERLFDGQRNKKTKEDQKTKTRKI